MTKKIPLHRLRDISKQRSIRGNHFSRDASNGAGVAPAFETLRAELGTDQLGLYGPDF